MIKIKRAYDAAQDADGHRILVDRIWPRGVSKDKAQLNDWDEVLAPTTALRKWFNHDAEKFDSFASRFEKEQMDKPTAKDKMQTLADLSKKQTVTLVYAAKDKQHNNAVVLARLLKKHYDGKIEKALE